MVVIQTGIALAPLASGLALSASFVARDAAQSGITFPTGAAQGSSHEHHPRHRCIVRHRQGHRT